MNISVSNDIPYSYLYNAALASGRVAVPVSASQLPYANFKHVAGTVVSGASVYALDKLKILDTLIDRLKSARAGRGGPEAKPDGREDEAALDAMIQAYGGELHKALVSDALAYAKPAGVVPGMLVSVAA